ncbi:MAG TPA: metallophosphoesterase [Burkholderiales bacterium]|nr:metallophosphoesterase [Burkholderiales bacterium]
MRKLLHLSDLHFGRVDTDLVDGLHAIAQRLQPDLIAVSGDLTQRAKVHEFAAARRFLESLRAPKVVVPGNHDVPLYNVFARFVDPLRRYRRYIGAVIEPTFMDEEIVVVGVNTARSMTFKGGRINAQQARIARAAFCDAGARVRVLVTHHPFHFRAARDRDLVRRASMALDHLKECMPDVLLAGHMHAHEIGTTAQRYDLEGKSGIVVQAGTATSTRGRGERNSFNMLHIDAETVTVWRYDWDPALRSFVPGDPTLYRRSDATWNEVGK